MSETLVNQIDNKNIYASRAVADEDGTNIKTSYALKSEIPTVPTMKSLVAGTNVSITETANGIEVSAGAVDQTYDALSQNAQSGVAVASAVSGKEDSFAVGDGLVMETISGVRTLHTEVSETVIWTPPTGYENANNYAIVLTESIHNFSEIAVYCKAQRTSGLQDTSKNVYPVSDSGNTMFADGSTSNHWNNNNNDNGFFYQGIDIRLTDATGYIGGNYRWGITNGTTTWECSRPADNNSIYLHPYKIVGINRVASN